MSSPARPPSPATPSGEHLSFGMEPQARRSVRRWTYMAMAVAMLFGLAIAFGPLALVSYQLQSFCDDLAPGTTLADLQAQAAENRFVVGPVDAGMAELSPAKASIKASCELRLDDAGRLLSARVNGG